MNGSEDDPLVRRAIDELRRMPAVGPDAVQSVVRAAATARITPADEPSVLRSASARSMRIWTAVGMAAAAAVVGFIARGSLVSRSSRATEAPAVAAAAASVAPAAPTRLVASSASDVVALPQQFVLENAHARRVAVVGDFNKWNPTSAPMIRSSEGALWSVIVPILPGRHMYGFMIDDSLFMLDPRAPRARDPDLGTEGSVLMVGRP